MSDSAERTAAIARVKLYVPHSAQPVLTDTEIEAIVDECQVAARWAAASAYVFGAMVRPVVDNGHYYRCEQAGTSDATEPLWPKNTGATITDGASDPILTWREAGTSRSGVFNVPLAIHKAWTIKAARASQLVKVDGQNYQQVYEHCTDMANRTAPLEFN